MIDLTITEALEKLKSREISATELTKAYLERIEKYGSELNCYITITPGRALADAAASDARYADGNTLPLDGIPIGMKDLFATKGIRTTAASHMLENFIPEYESTVSQNLIDAGTVLLGKTNLDEFAMGTFSKTSYFGAPVNPWQLERKLTAGGSSGGATSAIAGGLAIAGTGTDTGGSIRFPSAVTGLVGMKPTYGLCSRWGCVAFASSLDTPGPIARTVDDAALLLSAMASHDPKDSTSEKAGFHAHTPLEPVLGDGKKLRVGVIKEFADVEISPDMKKLFEARIADLKSIGAEFVEVSIPNILDALAAYYIIAPAEASSNLARYDGMRYGLRVEGNDLIDTYKKTRAAGFGEEVQRRMIVGTAVLSSESYEVYFMQAARVRRMIADSFNKAFEQCDLILCPSSAGTAMPLDSDLTPLEYYALDLFTVAMNLAGIPACSVPAGLAENGLPLGVQVVGKRFDDMRVLQLAKHIEQFAGVDNRPTKIMGK
ncbi:MAG TPA: Asp-tRNA(Asn)/Glu-tRNA(Gln) amidotransferase subunit GatA [Candidatus Enterousia avicola]|uniref:Glutamyl-tRNA(Gln) amidotransferase subunit A n=1 Tax=Candidatus Enterousia avicola TaxID=2840787 RepID=A0A9D1SMH0_9PROT|nr:Asp-tRNA(Asn)/Glu-tRNA(Gln) amidotransferase subunit GatA [Candidatus Enterousia avicola]